MLKRLSKRCRAVKLIAAAWACYNDVSRRCEVATVERVYLYSTCRCCKREISNELSLIHQFWKPLHNSMVESHRMRSIYMIPAYILHHRRGGVADWLVEWVNSFGFLTFLYCVSFSVNWWLLLYTRFKKNNCLCVEGNILWCRNVWTMILLYRINCFCQHF